MESPPPEIEVFRSARWLLPVYLVVAGLVVTMAAVGFQMEDPISLPLGSFLVFTAILLAWSGIHFSKMTTEVGPEGILVRERGQVREYKWVDVFVWQMYEMDKERRLTSQFLGKLFPRTWHDQEVGRPGFDRFLELFRQYAGNKERPPVL